MRKNGKDKLTYNHWDSYPSGLGIDIVKAIQKAGIEELRNGFDKIVLVNEDIKPTPEQIEKLKKYADTDVSSRNLEEWYVLLRNLQGDILANIEAGYMIDSHDFMVDSLFCEWAYIVNLDTNKLEVYEGFQELPHEKGRYAVVNAKDGYFPCALIREFDLDKVSEEDMRTLEDERE